MAERLIIGISGASGAIYGVRLLEALRGTGIETHLVVSRAGALTLRHETGLRPADLEPMADIVHPINDVGAACASGSFRTRGMVVAPCSMKTVAEIATGLSSTLLSRSADVVLKERRRLVLLVRESPLTSVHLRNMATISDMGGIICPPVPAFYTAPASVDDIVDHTVGRVLDLFDIDSGRVSRWAGLKTPPPPPPEPAEEDGSEPDQ
ncbi:MAG: UbiX family flavin prenyltransferase [Azospirillaceae bacterium]